MKINLHIERLVLDGLPFEARHGAALRAVVETELTRLLTQNDLASNWRTGGAVPGVQAAEIQLTTPGGPAGLGRQIARSIYGGISKAI